MPNVEHHKSSIDFGTQASASNTSHGSTPNDIPHPEFPGHPDPETVALDTQSAKSTVMRMAADGIPRLDVVQSLCLLALKDVMGSYPTPPSNFHNGHDLDQEDSRAPSKYVGINAHYIRTLMIWTKVVSYLHEIRSGRRETPWLSDSTYAKLNVEILDFDTELYPAHRLKNRGLSGRLHTELSKVQEYWYPWLIFARDPRVSMRAREDVRKFVALLEQISSSWPHLSHKLEILQSLQATAGCQLWGIEPKNTTNTFHSSKLWQLLDSNLADEFYASTFEGGDVMVDNRDPDIMLLEDRDMQQALDITSSTLPTAGALDNLPEKDCLSLFLPEDFEWLQAFYVAAQFS
ncbi:uncharacterized protein FOBCDRAFT_191527 [Fusarium oxysporum Fo47]|uniref:uncharacterized protein n=1 Tax=Fusarium oxysporum Fo47 TaxID=660027 RepID=UPI002869DBE4|nr:uncharacterized protein FOBCDRAFT_191527 [Fusarium oxysporum Fo47]QKD61196.2 hypothetical protein FOBCDRAFT_191527 [Fusarium oxysporum Fo47]